MEGTSKTLTIQQAKTFVLGGKAILTISNGRGEHYTFKFRRKEYPPRNRQTEPYVTWLVFVLTGQDNETDYSYIGTMNPRTLEIRVSIEHSTFTETSPNVRVLKWMLTHVRKQEPFEGRSANYSIRHEGRCGRCSRRLTTPESIDTGFGPECAGVMGIPWREITESQPNLLQQPEA